MTPEFSSSQGNRFVRTFPRFATQACLALVLPWAGASAQTVVTNAPVAPDTIYISRGGSDAGISVVDLNGFGQSTGNPAFSLVFGPNSKGESRFPHNPNLSLQGVLMFPSLFPGTTTEDGGSAGVFSLTLNSALEDRLVSSPAVRDISDMMLGQPLDLQLNNGSPFGCNSGGGSICSSTGFQLMEVSVGGRNTLMPTPRGIVPIHRVFGGGNPISFAPHPNPPTRLQVPLCVDPKLASQEPTSVLTSLQPPVGIGLFNLLAPGLNPLGDPSLGLPPTSLLSLEQNAFFTGPGPNQITPQGCHPYMMRQQLGHYLYVADRALDEIQILNSNTFELLTRIAVAAPEELAMEPNLRFLAVSSRGADEVVFIDIDPALSSFHEIVKRTPVGSRPAGIAWDSGNEDLIVCNEGDGTLSIISAATLRVRKTIRGLNHPFAIAITPRQSTFGHYRDVYFAYVLERSGALALFESGPDGVNGWGFDALIMRTDSRFPGPRALQADPLRVESGVWIAHEAGVSHVVLDSDSSGKIPLLHGELPNLRGLSLRIEKTLGRDVLSGSPRDIAFDNQRNFGALTNYSNSFSAGTPTPINGKSLVRHVPGQGTRNTSTPAYLFVSVGGPDGGAVDVIDLASGQRVDVDVFVSGTQSIAAHGVRVVMDYFRQ